MVNYGSLLRILLAASDTTHVLSKYNGEMPPAVQRSLVEVSVLSVTSEGVLQIEPTEIVPHCG
ncbi:hypothetical protein FRB94_004287 [Tulasnella sp. JGI-2019a]|nr:hypothetical protein FRB94_004287 [Tulasnella sp. JGI-2019a]